MVAPIIIALIVIAGGIGALTLTPLGGIVNETVDSIGFSDSTNTVDEFDDEATHDTVSGFEDSIHELIEFGGDMGHDSIDNSEFEGNAIGMTEGEAREITDSGIEFFKVFADFFFRGHDFIVALIYGLSPVAISLTVVIIIAFLVSLTMLIKHFHHAAHHWAIIALVIGTVMIFLAIVGGGLSI